MNKYLVASIVVVVYFVLGTKVLGSVLPSWLYTLLFFPVYIPIFAGVLFFCKEGFCINLLAVSIFVVMFSVGFFVTLLVYNMIKERKK